MFDGTPDCPFLAGILDRSSNEEGHRNTSAAEMSSPGYMNPFLPWYMGIFELASNGLFRRIGRLLKHRERESVDSQGIIRKSREI